MTSNELQADLYGRWRILETSQWVKRASMISVPRCSPLPDAMTDCACIACWRM
jgi:hypothetical protein